jgi:hypothetical protein
LARAWSWERQIRPRIRSIVSDEKQRSIAALSNLLPDRPIEQVTPNSASRRWNYMGCRGASGAALPAPARVDSARKLRRRLSQA